MIKVFVADDHAVVRRGIKQILTDENDIEVSGEAANADEILSQIYKTETDILILDITMPGRNGLDVLIQVKQRKPELHILILSMHPEEEFAIRAIKSGASGYLNKDSVPDELITAVRKINSGGRYISASLAESIAFSLEKNSSDLPHENLSDREFQVMCLLASGNTLKQIAVELSLSVKTVSTYRTRILEKLRMKTNVELTHYAIRHRLVVQM
jgi:two-component system, NarL family, invasion response regulator UvrY